MNIAELLHQRALEHPDRAAIVTGPCSYTLTFGELDQAAARAAALLRKAGLQAGDGVLILQPMSAELYVALAAVFRLGLVAMFIDPAAGTAHLERCCARVPPVALIASSKAHLLRLVVPALRRIPRKFAIGLPVPGATPWRQAQQLPPEPAIAACTGDHPALLTFTSGSTGEPKAAVRSHGFLHTQHQVLAQSLNLQPGGTDLATLPIVLLANLASGITSVIPAVDLRRPGAIDPAPVVAQLQVHRVNSTAASPALLTRLVEHCQAKGVVLPHLRRIFCGGAPVFPPLMAQLQQMAPAAEVVAVYGSTEAEPIAHLAHSQVQAADVAAMRAGRGLLAGKSVPEITLRILRNQWGAPAGPYAAAAFAADCLPPGQAGEIVVSGAHVLAGYLDGAGDPEIKLRVDGQVWHRTGDTGYLDGDGRLWLLGRCGAQVDDARGTLYPFTVECAAAFEPWVRRSALALQGNRRLLVLDCHGPASGRPTALAALQQELAWAQLDALHVVPRIPVDKRHNAKVDYPALQRMLAVTVTETRPAGAAGFWIRAAAEICDIVLVVGAFLLLLTPFYGWGALVSGLGSVDRVLGLWYYLVWAGLYDITFTACGGQTPGKRLVGIRVISHGGGTVPWANSALRYLGEIICAVTGIGYLLAAIHPEKRGLHDLLAGTRVIWAGR